MNGKRYQIYIAPSAYGIIKEEGGIEIVLVKTREKFYETLKQIM